MERGTDLSAINLRGDVRGQFDISLSAENDPAAIRASLQFDRGGNKTFARPAFGGSVFRASVQTKNQNGWRREQTEAVARDLDITVSVY